MADLGDLQGHLRTIKALYESEICSPDGNPAFLIRSGKLIKELHEYLKRELIVNEINPDLIFPPIGSSRPERVIRGFFKSKKQDILIMDKDENPLISINVRSQLSSVQKNYDTLFERLVAEAVNVHEKYPKLPCGYLYMLPTVGYNSNAMQSNRIQRTEYFNWEKYLTTFSYLADRGSENDKSFKFEKICLLAVDFSIDPPAVLKSTEDFLRHGLISSRFAEEFCYSSLKADDFIESLISIWEQRNGVSIRTLWA